MTCKHLCLAYERLDLSALLQSFPPSLSLICIRAFSPRPQSTFVSSAFIISSIRMFEQLYSMSVASAPSVTALNVVREKAYSCSLATTVSASSDGTSLNGIRSPVSKEVDQTQAKEQKLPIPTWFAVISECWNRSDSQRKAHQADR